MGGGTPAPSVSRTRLLGPSPRGRGNLVRRRLQRMDVGTIPAWAGEPGCGAGCRAPPGDHPRVGGGTSGSRKARDLFKGPSPRGRGNRPPLLRTGRPGGTIPAWAGEPSPSSRPAPPGGDHPRVGGGTAAARSCCSLATGPSPRGRGNRNIPWADAQDLRTIPAWAGEPGRPSRRSSLPSDHPRVGGGTWKCPCVKSVEAGPSPRGRGNPLGRGRIRVRRWTIPAWAGEPTVIAGSTAFIGDHPRVGGGTFFFAAASIWQRGPSPRGRGNHRERLDGRFHLRTIPAWAGEPSGCGRPRHRPGDHPRVGGGTRGDAHSVKPSRGPSPRGRGNRAPWNAQEQVLGTIPAWAGEPRRAPLHAGRVRDHPRVGGGTHSLRLETQDPQGPSPRGRGNRTNAPRPGPPSRTIPAWAGEPRADG